MAKTNFFGNPSLNNIGSPSDFTVETSPVSEIDIRKLGQTSPSVRLENSGFKAVTDFACAKRGDLVAYDGLQTTFTNNYKIQYFTGTACTNFSWAIPSWYMTTSVVAGTGALGAYVRATSKVGNTFYDHDPAVDEWPGVSSHFNKYTLLPTSTGFDLAFFKPINGLSLSASSSVWLYTMTTALGGLATGCIAPAIDRDWPYSSQGSGISGTPITAGAGSRLHIPFSDSAPFSWSTQYTVGIPGIGIGIPTNKDARSICVFGDSITTQAQAYDSTSYIGSWFGEAICRVLRPAGYEVVVALFGSPGLSLAQVMRLSDSDVTAFNVFGPSTFVQQIKALAPYYTHMAVALGTNDTNGTNADLQTRLINYGEMVSALGCTPVHILPLTRTDVDTALFSVAGGSATARIANLATTLSGYIVGGTVSAASGVAMFKRFQKPDTSVDTFLQTHRTWANTVLRNTTTTTGRKWVVIDPWSMPDISPTQRIPAGTGIFFSLNEYDKLAAGGLPEIGVNGPKFFYSADNVHPTPGAFSACASGVAEQLRLQLWSPPPTSGRGGQLAYN